MVVWFYYDQNEKKLGPVNDAQLIALAARGDILPDTVVETETGQKGKANQVAGLKFSSGIPVPPGPTTNMGMSPVPPSGFRRQYSKIDLLRLYYWRYVYGIVAMAFTVLLSVVGWGAFLAVEKTADSLIKFLFLVCGCALGIVMILLPIVIVCSWFMFLYVAWSIIPKENARTKPNKAVGYCFIPLFNLYWAFIAYQGLAEGINESLEAKGLGIRASEGKGTVLAVFGIWMCVPYANLILSVVYLFFSISYIQSIKEAAIALVNADFNNSPPLR